MSLKRTFALALVTLGFAVAMPGHARAAFVVPELTGPIVDNANVIEAEAAARLDQALRHLYEGGGSQIEVLTVPSLEGEEIEQASIQIADKWKIGRKKEGTGALLIVSTGDRKVRIEVGQGLEGVLPDAIAKRIIDEKMTPLLRAGSTSNAIVVGVASIIHNSDPTFDLASELGARRMQRSDDSRSGGPSPIVVIIFLIVILIFGAFGRRGGGGGFFIGGGGLGGGGFGGGGGSWGGSGGGFNGGGASGGW